MTAAPPPISHGLRSTPPSPDKAPPAGSAGTAQHSNIVVARPIVARIPARDGHLLPWNPGANAMVRSLALRDSVVYAGGQFTVAEGQSRSYVAALDATGAATSWNPGAGAAVNA